MKVQLERLINWAETELENVAPFPDKLEASGYWRGYIQALYDAVALAEDEDV